MLTEKQLERYAEVLLWAMKTARAKKFKKNNIVILRYHIPAIRLVEILSARILTMGMHPVQRLMPTPVMEKNFYEFSNLGQLEFTAPGEKKLYQNLNGSIFLYAPESITHLSGIDPRKVAKSTIAKKFLRDILDKREERGDFSWTLGVIPTKALADQARLSMKKYTYQIVNACFLNRKSPVTEWQNIYKNITRIKKWLNSMKIRCLHIASENIDLEITPGDRRRWLGLSGHNIPSFETFLSPDWRGTKGVYYANQPSFRSGNYVSGVRLEFKKGSATSISAEKGEDFLKKQLSMDRGANKVGEFSLTDKRFSRIRTFMANTLYDENYGGKYGNCHVALGSSYSDAYDGNPAELTGVLKKKLGFNDSALHWDLVNTEPKRVTARLTTGKKVTIYENGKFCF
ncbi:MAG: aminopeptidase [Deltaproteobacteria bacterium]|nr:MAG: aminopeptidase [Deltaproteobacteria bacterium]